MFKRNLLLKFGILASVGVLIALVFTTISGIEYRNREMAGLAPEYAPSWIVTGTNTGLVILGLGLLCMAVIGATHLVEHLRKR